MTTPPDNFLATREAISQILGRSRPRVAQAIERRGIEPVGTLEEHRLYDERGLAVIEDSLNAKKPKKRRYTRTTPRNRSTS